MSPLPLDYTRCAGRIGLGPDDPICADRQNCARYRTLEIDKVPDYRGVSVMMHMRDANGGCGSMLAVTE